MHPHKESQARLAARLCHSIPAVAALALTGGTLVPAAAVAAGPRAALAPRPARGQVVAWAPASPKPITVRRGRTVVEVVAFTNLRPLADIHIMPARGDADGTTIRILGTTLPASRRLDRYFRVVHVRFAVVAGRFARLGAYHANLHVDARIQGQSAYRPLPDALPFRVDVDRAPVAPPPAPAVIRWSPSDRLGTLTVQRGQTLDETTSFVSSADLSGVQVRHDLGVYAREHGVALRVTSTSLTGLRLLANTPVTVAFTVCAGLHARAGVYSADLYVRGGLSRNYGPRRLPNALTFRIDVDRSLLTATPTATAPTAMPAGVSTATSTAISTNTTTATNTAVPTNTATATVAPTGTATATIAPATMTATSATGATATVTP